MGKDFLDLMQEDSKAHLQAYYYDEYPVDKSVKGIPFTYEELEPRRRTYNQPIQNLKTAQETLSIKTQFKVDYKLQRFVRLANGRVYLIIDISEPKEEKDELGFDAFINPTKKSVMQLVGCNEEDY